MSRIKNGNAAFVVEKGELKREKIP